MIKKIKRILIAITNINFSWLILVTNLPLILNWTVFLASKGGYKLNIISSFGFQLLWFVIFYPILIIASYDKKSNLLVSIIAVSFIIFQPVNLIGSFFEVGFYSSSKCADFLITQRDQIFMDENLKYNPDRIFISSQPYLILKEIDFEFPNEGAPSGGPFSIRFDKANLSTYEVERIKNCYVSNQDLRIEI